MSTLVTENHDRLVRKTTKIYAGISLFCIVFSAVYEYFSHEVYSGYMIFAFLFPFAGGVLPFGFMMIKKAKYRPGALPLNLYHSGIAALTVGSIFQGVLEIYGTTNKLIKIYWIAGIFFTAAGIFLYLGGRIFKNADSGTGSENNSSAP